MQKLNNSNNMNTLTKTIKPENFEHTLFCPTTLGNSETEEVVGNIIAMQKKTNPNEWTPFSLEEYLESCPSPVPDEEFILKTILVDGGQPGKYEIPKGCLIFENGKYIITDILLSKIARFAKN